MLQVIGLGVILARSVFWTTATVLKQTCQKQRNIIRTNAHQEHKNDINCDQHVFSQPASSMIWTAADKSCHCFFHLAIAWNFKKCRSRHNINDTNLVQSSQTVELRELNQFGSPTRLPIDLSIFATVRCMCNEVLQTSSTRGFEPVNTPKPWLSCESTGHMCLFFDLTQGAKSTPKQNPHVQDKFVWTPGNMLHCQNENESKTFKSWFQCLKYSQINAVKTQNWTTHIVGVTLFSSGWVGDFSPKTNVWSNSNQRALHSCSQKKGHKHQ